LSKERGGGNISRIGGGTSPKPEMMTWDKGHARQSVVPGGLQIGLTYWTMRGNSKRTKKKDTTSGSGKGINGTMGGRRQKKQVAKSSNAGRIRAATDVLTKKGRVPLRGKKLIISNGNTAEADRQDAARSEKKKLL